MQKSVGQGRAVLLNMTLWHGLLSTRKTLRLHLVRPVARTVVRCPSALVEHIVLDGPPGAPTSMIRMPGPSVVLNVLKPTRKPLALVGMTASPVLAFPMHGRHLGKQGVKATTLLFGPAIVCTVRDSVFVVFAAGKTRPLAHVTLKCLPRPLVTVLPMYGTLSEGEQLRTVIGLLPLQRLITVLAKDPGVGIEGPLRSQLNMPRQLTLVLWSAVHLSSL